MNTAAVEIPKEHMDRVLNSLLCERLLGFERRMNEKMEYEWRGRRVGTGEFSDWDDALVDFAGDLKEAQRLLQQFCRQIGICYNLIYDPRNGRHTVVLLQIGDKGQPVPVVQISNISQLPQGIAAAIAGYSGFDLQEQHKLLYPGHYLLRS